MSIFFVSTPVTLKGTTTVVMAKMHVGIRSAGGGMRSARAEPLTGAVDQEIKLAIIMADDWDAVSPGRPPMKGDTFVNMGMRKAFERVHLAAPTGNKMVYKAEVKG